MSAFADVKDDKTLNEWLHETAFVTSTMSDPDEPQSFQEAWWDPDFISRENGERLFAWSSRRCWTLGCGDMKKEMTIQMTVDWLGVDGYLR